MRHPTCRMRTVVDRTRSVYETGLCAACLASWPRLSARLPAHETLAAVSTPQPGTARSDDAPSPYAAAPPAVPQPAALHQRAFPRRDAGIKLSPPGQPD